MPKTLFAFLCLILSTASIPLSAQTFNFLQQESNAKTMAMQSVANGDEGFAILQNPAFLSAHQSGMAELSFLNHLAGLKGATATYSKDLPKIGQLAGSVRYFSYGSIPQTDENGTENGSFTPHQMALTVGYSRNLKGIQIGANLHWAQVGAANYSANALVGDFGVAYALPKLRSNVHAALLNTGKILNHLGTTADELPTDLRVGFSHRLDKMPLTLHLTGYNLNRFSTADTTISFAKNALQHVNFGGEFRLGANLRMRLGYNHRKHEALKTKTTLDLAGVGFGIGLKVSKFKLDWGMNNWSQNGKIHQLTVSSTF